jgi:predicted component of type VI protein secretion system
MLRITILRRGTPEHVVDLHDRQLRIGRGAGNELLLRDPDKTVSRNHARIVRSGDGWVFDDQDSLNGCWMNGELVGRVKLEAGVAITMGDYELRCEARDMRSAGPEEVTRLVRALPPVHRVVASPHDTETRGATSDSIDKHLVAHFGDVPAAPAGTSLRGPGSLHDGSEPTDPGR